MAIGRTLHFATICASSALAVACASSSGGDPAGATGLDGFIVDAGSATDTDPTDGPASSVDAPEVIATPCANPGDPDCPPAGTYGDSLVLETAIGGPIEIVGLEVIDGWALTCTGFGLDANRVNTSPSYGFTSGGGALPRCQNITDGGMAANGLRIIYATNHGDGYVPNPYVATLHLDSNDGQIVVVDQDSVGSVSLEGAAIVGDELWVAGHSAGIMKFSRDAADGRLDYVGEIAGATNAWRLVADDTHVYVADGAGGMQIYERASESLVATIDTAGFAKDIAVAGDMVFVAASTMGVHVFDVTDRTAPTSLKIVFTYGSVLDLALFDNDTRLAVSNWADVAILDVSEPAALKVLAVDRGHTTTNDPRVLAIAATDDYILSGEWMGLGLLTWHPEMVGPELHVDRFKVVLGADPGQAAIEGIRITNRGWMDLHIGSISFAKGSVWSTNKDSIVLAPGDDTVLELLFQPTDDFPRTDTLLLGSNDPDEASVGVALSGNPDNTGKLDVGDELDASFDFLDLDAPAGSQSIQNLKGHVVLLGYFATF